MQRSEKVRCLRGVQLSTLSIVHLHRHSHQQQAAASILAVLHRDNTDQTPQHIIARHHRELTLKPQRQARTVTYLLYGSRGVSQQECAAEGSWQAEPLHNHSIRSNNGPWLYS